MRSPAVCFDVGGKFVKRHRPAGSARGACGNTGMGHDHRGATTDVFEFDGDLGRGGCPWGMPRSARETLPDPEASAWPTLSVVCRVQPAGVDQPPRVIGRVASAIFDRERLITGTR